MVNAHYKPYIFDYMLITHQRTSLRIKNSKPAPIPLRNIRISNKETHCYGMVFGTQNIAEPQNNAE